MDVLQTVRPTASPNARDMMLASRLAEGEVPHMSAQVKTTSDRLALLPRHSYVMMLTNRCADGHFKLACFRELRSSPVVLCAAAYCKDGFVVFEDISKEATDVLLPPAPEPAEIPEQPLLEFDDDSDGVGEDGAASDEDLPAPPPPCPPPMCRRCGKTDEPMVQLSCCHISMCATCGNNAWAASRRVACAYPECTHVSTRRPRPVVD